MNRFLLTSLSAIGFSLLHLPIAAQSAPIRPQHVPEDAKPFQGNWYKIFNKTISWTDAQAECVEMGGHLAVAPDKETWTFISNTFKTNYWLGADNLENGEWRWIDGTPLTFTAWGKNEPDNWGNREHYLATIDSAWVDISIKHNSIQAYLCQWKSQPSLLHIELEKSNPDIAVTLHQLRQEVDLLEADHDAQVGKIEAGYLTAVQRELDNSTSRGDLETAVLLKDEQQRFRDGQGPGTNESRTPAFLVKLRATYHQQIEKLQKARNAKAAPIFKKYDTRLEAIQTKLTKEKNLDQALELQAFRKALSTFLQFWQSIPGAPSHGRIRNKRPSHTHFATSTGTQRIS